MLGILVNSHMTETMLEWLGGEKYLKQQKQHPTNPTAKARV